MVNRHDQPNFTFGPSRISVMIGMISHFFSWGTGKEYFRDTLKALEIAQTTFKRMPRFVGWYWILKIKYSANTLNWHWYVVIFHQQLEWYNFCMQPSSCILRRIRTPATFCNNSRAFPWSMNIVVDK